MKARWYQEEGLCALFDYFETHGGTNPDGTPVRANPLVCWPTGTGKAFGIGEFDRRAIDMFPRTRILNTTHVKELVENNAKTARKIAPGLDIGVYSAGLKLKQTNNQVIYGSIQSMYKNADLFGWVDILKIDEAHLLSPASEGRYLEFLTGLWAKNPYMKIVGFTATPYRLGLGHMTNGNIFTDVAHDITGMESFNRLIAEGYLCPVIPQRTATPIDLSNLQLGSDGEYTTKSMAAAFDRHDVTFSALKEVVGAGQFRASWMIFASSIEHAEHVTEMLRGTFGIPAVCVHSKMTPEQRDYNIMLFKTGQVRCLVNKDILTTGFDHPPVDLIAILRVTNSTGLWVQMLGRGTRPYDYRKPEQYIPGFNYTKLNCLVLDFGGNTQRLGPINDPVIPKKRGEGPAGDSPIKQCPKCPTWNHSSARHCINCGYEFPNEGVGLNIEITASTADLIRSDMPEVEFFDVQRVLYDVFKSPRSGALGIKVAYHTASLRTFYETLWFEPPVKPYAIHQAHDWFKARYPAEPPATVREVMALTPFFRIPSRIRVWINAPKQPEVLGAEF